MARICNRNFSALAIAFGLATAVTAGPSFADSQVSAPSAELRPGGAAGAPSSDHNQAPVQATALRPGGAAGSGTQTASTASH